MKFWKNIVSGLKARKGEFTGTSGNEAKISERLDNNKSVNISNPTSYRTYQNVGNGTLNEEDIDIGLTSGKGAEITSTAIKSAQIIAMAFFLNNTAINLARGNGRQLREILTIAGKEHKIKSAVI